MSKIYIIANTMNEDFIIHAATTSENVAQALYAKLNQRFKGTDYREDLEILVFSDADANELLNQK